MSGPIGAVLSWFDEAASTIDLPGAFRLPRRVRLTVTALGLVALMLYAPVCFGVTETLQPLDAAVAARRIMGRQQWVGQSGARPALASAEARQ